VRFGRVFYIIAILICVFEIVRLWNLAPAQMAAHFNAQGSPDRFVSKAEFFWFQIQTMLIVTVVSIPLQILFLVLPVNLINMPNREYWLAPERRAETVDRLSSFAAMMFGVILLAIQAGFELSVYANLRTPILFNAQWMLMVIIISIVLIGLMLIQLRATFHLPSSNDRAI
jgi:uncharacterized membrane protein